MKSWRGCWQTHQDRLSSSTRALQTSSRRGGFQARTMCQVTKDNLLLFKVWVSTVWSELDMNIGLHATKQNSSQMIIIYMLYCIYGYCSLQALIHPENAGGSRNFVLLLSWELWTLLNRYEELSSRNRVNHPRYNIKTRWNQQLTLCTFRSNLDLCTPPYMHFWFMY